MSNPDSPQPDSRLDAESANQQKNSPAQGDGYEVIGDSESSKSSAGKVGKDSVLAGFDAETDFEKDIAAAEAKKAAAASPRFVRPKRQRPATDDEVSDSNVADVDDVDAMPVDGMPLPLIKPAHRSGLDAPKVLFAVGGVIVLIAMIASGLTAKSQNLAVACLAGYQTILHTITGVVALVVISLLHGRPVGSYEQGAARLFVAIGLFQLVMGLEFGLFDGKAEEFAIGAVVYALAMMALFRMRFKVILEIIAVHLLIIGVMWLGTQLAIAAVPTVKR